MKRLLRPLLISFSATLLISLILWIGSGVLTIANETLIYALLVLLVTIQFGTTISIIVAIMSIVFISYFLAEPIYVVAVSDPREVLDLGFFIIIALVGGQLALRAKRRAIRQLEQTRLVATSEQLKTALLHAVSHDLRTPLTIIRASAENLMQLGDTLPPDEKRNTIEAIDRESRVLDKMVGQLLDMSRLQAGAMPMTRELNSLEEVAGDAAGQAFARVGKARITLHFPDSLPLVKFDYGLLLRAVSNLVDNALRYEPDDRQIEMRGTLQGEEARLMVVNHGSGIPESQREAIFQPFTVGERGKLGLGLAIARGIVEAHRGRIWVEDTPGGGATFIIALPSERQAAL